MKEYLLVVNIVALLIEVHVGVHAQDEGRCTGELDSLRSRLASTEIELEQARAKVKRLQSGLDFETNLCVRQIQFLKTALEDMHVDFHVPLPPPGTGCPGQGGEAGAVKIREMLKARHGVRYRMPYSNESIELGVDEGVVSKSSFFEDASSGKWELETYRVLNQQVYPGIAYVGLGEQVGVLGLVAAQRANKAILVEPDHDSYLALMDNLERNRNIVTGATIVESRCIIDDDDKVVYFQGCGKGGSTVLPRVQWSTSSEWYPVGCTSLPVLFEEHRVSHPAFVKVDIEGAESILLPSIRGWLRSLAHKPSLFISFHKQADDWQREAIAELLNMYSYYAIIATSMADEETKRDSVNGLCERGVLLKSNVGGRHFHWSTTALDTSDVLVVDDPSHSAVLCADEYRQHGIPLPV